jgi:perosamine synthetase
MEHLFVPELPTLDPTALPLFPALRQRFPLDRIADGRAQLFYLARGGVYHSVRHLIPPGGRVLMPSYHHGVEVEAVLATGAQVSFYRVDADMRIDLDDIRRQLPADLVYVTHYAGFAQPIDEAAALCRQAGARLFEDCALSLLSAHPDGRPLGTTGDASVFCLYKALPVPHGGVLVSPTPMPVRIERPPLLSTLHHMAGQALCHLELRFGATGRVVRQAMRGTVAGTMRTIAPPVQVGTMHLDPEELTLGASRLLMPLLERIDLDEVVARRRRNFQRLARQLDGVVPVLHASLADGVSPLFVPVRVRDKAEAVSRLRHLGVQAIDFWNSSHPACDLSRFPETARLRREILELPCHQSLDEEDLDRMARAAWMVLR